MKTLTVTKARAKLGHWVKRAAAGEDIGIVIGAKLVALRPVPIEAGDYAAREYGLTAGELDAAAARIQADARRALAAGECITGEDFIRELERKHQPGRPKRRGKAVRR